MGTKSSREIAPTATREDNINQIVKKYKLQKLEHRLMCNCLFFLDPNHKFIWEVSIEGPNLPIFYKPNLSTANHLFVRNNIIEQNYVTQPGIL